MVVHCVFGQAQVPKDHTLPVQSIKCQHFCLFVCYMAGWADRTKDCLHKNDIAIQLLHCCFFFPLSPNRRNPEMNPNPVSCWLDPWKGSSKRLMVNKQYTGDSVCMLYCMYFILTVSKSASVCFSVLYEYHEVSSGNDSHTTRVKS